MNTFDVDALRRATGHARFATANDLVQRTLAQHGLVPAGASMPATAPSALPGLAGLQALRPVPAVSQADLPPGASFASARYDCAAGGRDYLLYLPSTAAQGVRGVVLMLHGCTQTHGDFATGTGMNALAEQHRLAVIYPQQSRGDNAQSCWNWFSPGDQRRGRGEPAILAGLTSEVAQAHDVAPAHTFVAGLSAGAAMAVILGQTYGDVFAAVGAHSGLPHGAARDVPSAFAAMAGSPAGDQPRGDSPRGARTIVFHGSADSTVHISNGERIAADVISGGPAQTMVNSETGQANGRRFTREITRTTDGVVLLEHWTVTGLGHAWSGGKAGGSYTDPAGPDASAEMVRFFLDTPDREA